MKESVQFVERFGTASLKWDLLEKIYGHNDMISMWVADMDFRCPECVHEAFQREMKVGAYGYSALHTRFMKAFAEWEEKRHGYTAQMDSLRYAPGVVPAVNWCVLTMTEPGDHVLTLPPVYYPFFSAAAIGDRVLEQSALLWDGHEYTMNFAEIEEKIVAANVKMLIFCSPHNPVGRVWRREELEKLAEICKKHHVIIVSDEIHQDYVFGEHKHIPMSLITEENMVLLTAPSKTFNLAGLNTAVAVIPQEDLRKKWDDFTKMIHVTMGSTFGYLAGEAAYLHGDAWLEDAKNIIYGNYQVMKERLLAAFPKLQIPELEGTYLMWVDFGEYLKPEEQKEFFTEKCRIALDYGSWFRGGSDNFVRFNLATSRELVEKAAEAVIRALTDKLSE